MGLGPSDTDRIVLPDLPRVRIVLNESPEGVGTVVVAPLCRIAGRSARAFGVLDVPRARRYEVETPDRDDVVDIHSGPSVEILVSEARHVALRSDIRDQRVTGIVDVRPDEVVELALRCGRLDYIESSGVPVLIDRADHVTEAGTGNVLIDVFIGSHLIDGRTLVGPVRVDRQAGDSESARDAQRPPRRRRAQRPARRRPASAGRAARRAKGGAGHAP